MAKSPNALELLRRDHREVLQMLRQFERTGDPREQGQLCRDIVDELDQHAALEEDVFYPYVRDTSDRLELIEEAFIEHDSTKDLMNELRREDAGSPRFQALMKVLGEYVALHVREEEERIFPLVEKMGIDLQALGEELAEHRGGGNGHDRGRRARERGASRAHGKEHRVEHTAAHRRADKTAGLAPAHEPAGHGGAHDTAGDHPAHGNELSRSSRHALWIHAVDQHADHDGQTLATRNPDVIRQWADERGGRPATTPGGDADNPRVLRIDFPDYDRNLQPVTWDAWLKVFNDRDLVFLYQETMKAGNPSNFFRLDSPDREDG
jgi:hemerythrin superfamily protein